MEIDTCNVSTTVCSNIIGYFQCECLLGFKESNDSNNCQGIKFILKENYFDYNMILLLFQILMNVCCLMVAVSIIVKTHLVVLNVVVLMDLYLLMKAVVLVSS